MRGEFLAKCCKEELSGHRRKTSYQIVGSCCSSATMGYNMETMVEQIWYWKNHNNAMHTS